MRESASADSSAMCKLLCSNFLDDHLTTTKLWTYNAYTFYKTIHISLKLSRRRRYRGQSIISDGTLLNKWNVKLNQSSVTVDGDGRITVKYSGIYIVHSSLAFTCNSVNQPDTQKTIYWQEIRVNSATFFRDAENITRVPVLAKPSYCYRSFLYGLLRLTANDSIQVFAGPPELLHCVETMSFFVLNRP